MIRLLSVLIFSGCMLLLLPHAGRAQGSPRAMPSQEIAAPFGLDWGESEARLEPMLLGAKSKIVEKRILEGRDMWTVEGLVQANLYRTIFYFKNDGLDEVELQYRNKAWAETDYDSFLSQLREKVEKRYGDGKLIARSKTQQADVNQTLVGYQWSKNGCAIEVIYFAAEKPSQNYRIVSLHYKILE